MPSRLIRLPELTSRLGIGKTKVYALISQGDFPAPIKIGKVSVWHSEAVDDWMKRLAIQQTIE